MSNEFNLEVINSDDALKKLYVEYLKATIERDTLNMKIQTANLKASMIEDKKKKTGGPEVEPF